MQNMYKLHKTSKSSLTLSEVGGFGFPECANILPNGHTIFVSNILCIKTKY